MFFDINEKIASFLSGIIVGFVQGWQLTLGKCITPSAFFSICGIYPIPVIISVTPILVILVGIMTIKVGAMAKKSLEAYALAGGVAEECISNIRTVTTFNASKKESARYPKE